MTFLMTNTSRENLQHVEENDESVSTSRSSSIIWTERLIGVLGYLCTDASSKLQVLGVFSNSQWLSLIHRGSDKTRFQYCLDSIENVMYFRAIQAHSGGVLVGPQFFNYVVFPLGWKEYLYHVGGLRVHFILQAGLIEGGKDTKERDGRLSSAQIWTSSGRRTRRGVPR